MKKIPLYLDRIYAVDIETRPIDYQDIKYTPNPENEDIELIHEEFTFYPWLSEIFGMSVCWGSDFSTECIYFEKDEIEEAVKFLSSNKLKLAGHNILYDWLHLYYHFGLPLNFVADSGVYSQCINNSDTIQSFGLKQTVERMFNVVSQDFEVKEYLFQNFKIPASKYGSYIYKCPLYIVEKYCKLDAFYSLKICTDAHKYLKSDVSLYMKLFVNEVKMTIQQFIEGIEVDREGLEKERSVTFDQINKIEYTFFNHPELKEHIKKVQYKKYQLKQATYKKKILDFEEFCSVNPFNTNSSQQLKDLFDSQKLHWDEKTQKFKYPYVNFKSGTKIENPDSPKLGTKFLHAYGIGGEILADKSEKMTLCQHISSTLREASFDNKLHAHINLLGAKSGRISSSGANIIAMPIKDKSYGSYLKVNPPFSILSIDFIALEPSILAALSNDPLLKYTCAEGIGKEPFFKNGILYINDIYISAAYSATFLRKEIENIFDLNNWLKDPEFEKRKIKTIRNISKIIILSTNYGAGALKIQATIREILKITIEISKIIEFQESYWASISTAYLYKKELERKARTDGYLVNIGGFPLIFTDRVGGKVITGTHKALNRMIQSTANICMKLFNYYLYQEIKKRNDFIPLITNYHDAHWAKVLKTSIPEFIDIIQNKVLFNVNKTLNFPIDLSISINHGPNFYDAQ